MEDLVDSLLEVAAVDFVVVAALSGLDTLGLHQHCLALLLVLSIVLSQDGVLVGFNHLNTSLLKRFTDKDLKDGLSLHLEIEQIRVVVVHLNRLVGSLFVRNVSSGRRSVNIVVGLDLRLVLHVVVVVEVNPIVLRHHLRLLLVHLHLLLLGELILVVGFLSVHLLLSHLLLLHFLLLHAHKMSQS